MPRNIGNIDQVVRALLGLAGVAYFLSDGFYFGGLSLIGLLGVYLLATALFLYCPLYALLGLSTFGPLDRSV
jgi:DUF2892 family protein